MTKSNKHIVHIEADNSYADIYTVDKVKELTTPRYLHTFLLASEDGKVDANIIFSITSDISENLSNNLDGFLKTFALYKSDINEALISCNGVVYHDAIINGISFSISNFNGSDSILLHCMQASNKFAKTYIKLSEFDDLLQKNIIAITDSVTPL